MLTITKKDKAAMLADITHRGVSVAIAVRRVNKGLAFLDRNSPGWIDEVAISRLNMSHSNFCIIGQLHGDYSQSVAHFFGKSDLLAERDAVRHGFQSSDTVPYSLLDALWVSILKRRAVSGKREMLKLAA